MQTQAIIESNVRDIEDIQAPTQMVAQTLETMRAAIAHA